MKSLSGCVAAIVLVFTGAAQAEFIHVISQEYHVLAGVWAEIVNGETAEWVGGNSVGLEETSSGPVAVMIDTESLPPLEFPLAYAGGAEGGASAGGAITAASASLWADASVLDIGGAFGLAGASASLTFSPVVDAMRVSLSMDGYSDFTLIDSTSDGVLYDHHSHQPGIPDLILMTLTSFDPSHIYSMVLSSSGQGFSDVSIAPIPEPATMLLLATGLVGLGGVAWRRHRRG